MIPIRWLKPFLIPVLVLGAIIAVLGHYVLAAVCIYLFLLARIMRPWETRLCVNNPTIKGDTTVLWGTSGGTTITGYIVSVRDMLTGELVEVPDDNGYTVAAIFFNDRHEGEVEIIVQSSYPSLTRGQNVTVMGVSGYLVQDVEKVWENKGVQKLRVKATNWTGLTP